MQELKPLLDAMQQKNVIVLYRDALGAPEFAGIPVAVGKELTVLHRENDFMLDGYTALRTGDVTEWEQMDDIPFCRRALEGGKVYEAVKAIPFPADDWNRLLVGIQKAYGGWCAVECENPEEPLYFFGRIQTVEGRYLTMQQVDAGGQALPDLMTLALDEITLVSFGDRYTEAFRKHCKC